MKKFCFLLLLLSALACKKDQKVTAESDNLMNTEAFQEKLEIKERNIQLAPEARNYALEWVAYITAQNEIERLEKASVGEIAQNSKAISQIMMSLKNSVPDSLKSISVNARLNVVSTKAQLLNQLAERRKKDPKLIAQTAEELHLEFSNLKIQLNELFLETLEDFEKELDEFEREESELFERDSLDSISG